MAQQKKEVKLRIPEQLQAGTYANNSLISHTKEEFILDFLMIVPPVGSVVSRVVVNPYHMKRMMAALKDNIKKYEEKFGPIQSAEFPTVPMGYSD